MKKVALKNYDSRSTSVTAGAVFQIVLGVLSVCAGIVLSVSQRLLHLFTPLRGHALSFFLVAFFSLGVWLLHRGIRGVRLSRRFAALDSALSEGPVSFSRMLTRLNLDEKSLLSDLGRMIARGGFWMSAAVLEDCIVLERNASARPQMLMADEGMSFSEKKYRGRIPLSLLAGICGGTALIHPFPARTLIAALAASLILHPLSAVFFPKRFPVIRYQKQSLPQPAANPIVEASTGNAGADRLIAQGQEQLRELTTLGVTITDPHVRMRIEEISTAARQLLGLLKSHPEKQAGARQTIEYRLPTAVKLLRQFDELSSQPVKGENIRESLERITEMSDLVAEAMGRELDALYEDRALNIEVDVEVLKSMMQESMDIGSHQSPEPKPEGSEQPN